MSSSGSFHDIAFPMRIAFGASGGPERRTEIVTLGSGREARNGRWAHARRRFDVGQGIRGFDDLDEVVAFFEERRGRLHGFRFRDRTDCKSCKPGRVPSAFDQLLGRGDGVATDFQLVKAYGTLAPYRRTIRLPLAGSLLVAVAGEELPAGAYSVDGLTGLVRLSIAPPGDALVTAGFQFDIPARFDSDQLTVNLAAFDAGEIPSVPVVELLI